MAGETVVTIVGNLASDPELRYTQGGVAVVGLNVGSTPSTFNRQTSAWRELAENVAQTLTKGTRVIVTGRLKPASAYQSAQGEARASIEIEIDEIGPSLRYATASVTRRARNVEGGGQTPWGNADAPAADKAAPAVDGWASPGTASGADDTPF